MQLLVIMTTIAIASGRPLSVYYDKQPNKIKPLAGDSAELNNDDLTGVVDITGNENNKFDENMFPKALQLKAEPNRKQAQKSDAGWFQVVLPDAGLDKIANQFPKELQLNAELNRKQAKNPDATGWFQDVLPDARLDKIADQLPKALQLKAELNRKKGKIADVKRTNDLFQDVLPDAGLDKIADQHPMGLGMMAEHSQKSERKFDGHLTTEASAWIRNLLEDAFAGPTRPRVSGLSTEVSRKLLGKYDEAAARAALQWIGRMLNDTSIAKEDASADSVHELLKDGIILCKLMNALVPGSIKKINTDKMPFKQMENINNFREACATFGVRASDLFQTVDLYEATNMPQVINTIYALSRTVMSNGDSERYKRPEEARKNGREFTEEQLRAGQAVIGLQTGSNKGASQAGQNFGKSRAIVDK